MKKCQAEGGELNREKIIKRALIQVFRNRYKEKRLDLLARLTELSFGLSKSSLRPCYHSAPRGPGRTACLQWRQPINCPSTSTDAHRTHVRHYKTTSVSRRVAWPDRTSTVPPDAFRLQILRFGGAAQNDVAPLSARALQKSLWRFVSDVLMVSDAPLSGHSEDVFSFMMARILLKIQPFEKFPDFKCPPVI